MAQEFQHIKIARNYHQFTLKGKLCQPMQYQSCFLNNFVTPTFPVPMSSSYCSQMYPVRTYCSCMFRIRFTLRWFKNISSYWLKQFYPSTQELLHCIHMLRTSTSNSCEFMGVNGEALQLCTVYKKAAFLYQHYNSCENPYQVLQVSCAASDHAMKLKVHMIKSLSPQY